MLYLCSGDQAQKKEALIDNEKHLILKLLTPRLCHVIEGFLVVNIFQKPMHI